MIRSEDPAFHAMLMARSLPPDWTPDPTITANHLATMTRDECRACGNAGARSQCMGCHVARYCSVECQKKDWRMAHSREHPKSKGS